MMGAYEDARSFWLKAYEVCGGTEYLDEGFFINGRMCYELLRDSVYTEGSLKYQQVNDSITWFYEQNLIVATSELLNLKYAGYLIESKSTNISRIDELLISIDSLKAQTPARYIGLSFKHLILNHYNNAEQKEKFKLKNELFERYFVLIDYANGAIILNEEESDEQLKKKRIKAYNWSKGFLSKYIVIVVNEPELVEQQMQKQFEQLPTDPIPRLERILEHIALLEKFKVSNSPVYSQYIYASLALKPSSNGYVGIGNIEIANDQIKKGIAAYLKALELSNTIEEKDDINLRLAQAYYQSKAYRKAFNAANKVEDSNRASALIICGNSIAALARSCGESSFDRMANFWLANDYYRNAASLGAEVSSSQFLDLAPSPEKAFVNGFTVGDQVEIACWSQKQL